MFNELHNALVLLLALLSLELAIKFVVSILTKDQDADIYFFSAIDLCLEKYFLIYHKLNYCKFLKMTRITNSEGNLNKDEISQIHSNSLQ